MCSVSRSPESDGGWITLWLLTLVYVLTALFLVGMTAYRVSERHFRLSLSLDQARQFAESGVELALDRLKRGLGPSDFQFGESAVGQISVIMTKGKVDHYIITSTGRAPVPPGWSTVTQSVSVDIVRHGDGFRPCAWKSTDNPRMAGLTLIPESPQIVGTGVQDQTAAPVVLPRKMLPAGWALLAGIFLVPLVLWISLSSLAKRLFPFVH